ncbi:hypothetical protein M426DRAFT_13446 [Hypoxylon sp. CI-4A]|nr:hypothetical protein M426DRAFT_13446 [Hypoxylon sp. CI-4A]
MFKKLALALAAAASVMACDLPTDILSNNITQGFSIQIQNAAVPKIHNHYLNLWDWGGGDEHLFVSPAGRRTTELQLINGVITLPWDPPRRAVINGEHSDKDNTTKLFMTARGDPRAIFDVVYGCNPDTDAVQVELAFKSRGEEEQGGAIGVREFSGDLDFRWTPAGNTAFDPDRPWTRVRFVVIYP